jgi:hypothetical protein
MDGLAAHVIQLRSRALTCDCSRPTSSTRFFAAYPAPGSGQARLGNVHRALSAVPARSAPFLGDAATGEQVQLGVASLTSATKVWRFGHHARFDILPAHEVIDAVIAEVSARVAP